MFGYDHEKALAFEDETKVGSLKKIVPADSRITLKGMSFYQ